MLKKPLKKVKTVTIELIQVIHLRGGSFDPTYLQRKALYEEIFAHERELIISKSERSQRIPIYTEYTRLRDLFSEQDKHRVYFLTKSFTHFSMILGSIFLEAKRIQVAKLTGLKTIPVNPLSFIVVSSLAYSTFAFLESYNLSNAKLKTIFEVMKYGTGIAYLGTVHAINALTYPLEKTIFKKPIEIYPWDDLEMISFLIKRSMRSAALQHYLRKQINSIEPIDPTLINTKHKLQTDERLTFIKKPSITMNLEKIEDPHSKFEVKLQSGENSSQLKELDRLSLSKKISSKLLEIIYYWNLDILD